ncbi:MAG: hypothetical protein ACKOB4_18070, partial [Acidobacteriota bacterium]
EIQTSTTDSVVMAPLAAIVTFAGIQKLFLVRDGKAFEKNVVVGRKQGDWVVVDGVEAAQQIVLSPGGLVTGQPITTKQ